MSRTAQLIIGAVTDFVITAGTGLAGYMVAKEGVVMPSPAMILLACVLGAIAAAKQVRGMALSLKPLGLVLALVGLTGCAGQIAALSKDGASVCARVKALLYGEAAICRTNTPGAAILSVDKDGAVTIQHKGSK